MFQLHNLFKFLSYILFMIKRICFFSNGFAFNRLTRMRFYEKIFPKDTEIFLFTTNKYESKEEARKKWDLQRTKIFVDNYHAFKTNFNLRNFCRKNKIQRLVNLGAPGAGIPFMIATFLSNRDYLMGYYGKIVKYKRVQSFIQKIQKFALLPQYWLVGRFAKKLVFTDKRSFIRAPLFFLKNKNKIHYAEAPVNTDLFKPKNKISARKKLKLPLKKNIIIRVGRMNHAKCGDTITELVKANPEIYFILIGKWLEEEVPKLKTNNFIYFERKENKELVDYYNAADLAFGLHRAGMGYGIVAEESLACGIPTILPERLNIPQTPAIIKSSDSIQELTKKINSFLSLPQKEKQNLSNKARDFAQKYLSDDVWKKRFIDFHLA